MSKRQDGTYRIIKQERGTSTYYSIQRWQRLLWWSGWKLLANDYPVKIEDNNGIRFYDKHFDTLEEAEAYLFSYYVEKDCTKVGCNTYEYTGYQGFCL